MLLRVKTMTEPTEPKKMSMQELIDYLPGYEWITPPENDESEDEEDEE